MLMEISEQTLWSFVRGDISAEDFERFVYASGELEGLLGKDKYLELLAAGYRDENDILELKQMLRVWLEENRHRICDCMTWNRNQIIPLGCETPFDVFLLTFEVLKERNPWLELVRCKMCSQDWYIATDTVDDEYRLLRPTEEQVNEIVSLDKWPSLFDDVKNVWPDPHYAPVTSN